jgi:hypothetical protein
VSDSNTVTTSSEKKWHRSHICSVSYIDIDFEAVHCYQGTQTLMRGPVSVYIFSALVRWIKIIIYTIIMELLYSLWSNKHWIGIFLVPSGTLNNIVSYRPVARQRPRNKETTGVARQRPEHNNRSTVGSGVFCVVRSEAVSRDWPSSVELMQCREVKSWLVS